MARLARFKPLKAETSEQLSAPSVSTNQQASTTDTLERQDASDSKDASSDFKFACVPGRHGGSSSESAQGQLDAVGVQHCLFLNVSKKFITFLCVSILLLSAPTHIFQMLTNGIA